METKPKKVGIVGFGNLGQYLVERINETPTLELAFIWNRSHDKLIGKIDSKYIITDLVEVSSRDVDIIVEVADPCITKKYGELFLDKADYLIGSPTALADQECETKIRAKAMSGPHGLYVPAGAFWGGSDVQKMAALGTLKALKVTMKKHPDCFKLRGELKEKNKNVTSSVTLYDGSVRNLCPLAPNNVNTMACAAIAASNLGFDVVQGCIVSDPSLNCHIVEIEVTGPGSPGNEFTVKTTRTNPSAAGSVTGNATYGSFFSSLLVAGGRGEGVHLC